ncbi:MAG TPA: hypothetical protein VFS92_07315 [Planctomycetota bacterium]|nr:hypothetical protein [Planctomycetota bacterium]
MLSSEEFKAVTAEVVPFLHVTSRVEGEHHPKLLEEKGGRGFPYLVVLDAKGEVLSQVSDRSVEGFRKAVKDAGDFTTLSAKEKRTPAEEMRLLRLQHGMHKVEDDAARARANAIDVTDEAVKKDRDAFLFGLDIAAQLKGRNFRDPAAKIAAGKTFHEWWKAGKEPPDEGTAQPFFILMLDYAESERNVELFEKALGRLRDMFGAKTEAARFFKMQEERLQKLKAPATPVGPDAPVTPPPEGGK